jgi:hypothetical protein
MDLPFRFLNFFFFTFCIQKPLMKLNSSCSAT